MDFKVNTLGTGINMYGTQSSKKYLYRKDVIEVVENTGYLHLSLSDYLAKLKRAFRLL